MVEDPQISEQTRSRCFFPFFCQLLTLIISEISEGSVLQNLNVHFIRKLRKFKRLSLSVAL